MEEDKIATEETKFEMAREETPTAESDHIPMSENRLVIAEDNQNIPTSDDDAENNDDVMNTDDSISISSDKELETEQKHENIHHESTDDNGQSVRCYFTPEQRTKLENIFKTNAYPDDDERMEIANDLDVCEKRIKVWFTNRRSKLFRSGEAEPSAKQRFTAAQKHLLGVWFERNRYPDRETVSRLTDKIKASSKRIKIWFNNQRVKKKCTRGKRLVKLRAWAAKRNLEELDREPALRDTDVPLYAQFDHVDGQGRNDSTRERDSYDAIGYGGHYDTNNKAERLNNVGTFVKTGDNKKLDNTALPVKKINISPTNNRPAIQVIKPVVTNAERKPLDYRKYIPPSSNSLEQPIDYSVRKDPPLDCSLPKPPPLVYTSQQFANDENRSADREHAWNPLSPEVAHNNYTNKWPPKPIYSQPHYPPFYYNRPPFVKTTPYRYPPSGCICGGIPASTPYWQLPLNLSPNLPCSYNQYY